jgi:uncharacterized protein (DUF58 family)
MSAVAQADPTAEPGHGPLPAAVLRALELTIARRVDGLLFGDYRSAQLGRGTELAQVRPYRPGDDVRQIDWNVTARTREPHVRVQLAERVLVSWLVLDLSPSMRFGTADRRKSDVAEGVALAVGTVASRRGNRLGAVLFGDGGARVLPPKHGRQGLLEVLAALREEGPHAGAEHPETDVEDALVDVAGLARERSLVLLVSDLRGPRVWYEPLLQLAGRHDVVAVEIRDRREQELPNVGPVWLVDPESGRQVRVDTRSEAFRRRFAAAAEAERAEVATLLASGGIGHCVLTTEGDWLLDLVTFLRHRRRRR